MTNKPDDSCKPFTNYGNAMPAKNMQQSGTMAARILYTKSPNGHGRNTSNG